MKKQFNLMLLFGALGTLFGTTSCKKDWKCECEGYTVATYPKVTKATAKKSCDLYASLAGVSCSVK